MTTLKDFSKSHIETFFLILIGLITLFFSIIHNLKIVEIFTNIEYQLNDKLITTFGTLFGLLLTTYAIFFGLIPILNKEFRKTNAYKKINCRFFITTIMSLVLLCLSFISIFIPKSYINYIAPLQVTLSITVVLMFLLLTTYLYLLFRSTFID